jgi:hypothetical protein
MNSTGFPANPNAEPKAPVEGGGLFGDEDRLALGQNQHLGRKLDLTHTAGKKAEQDKRVHRSAEVLRPPNQAGSLH